MINIELDSLVAVRLINDGCYAKHLCYTIVKNIKILSSSREMVSFSHAFREANQLADTFANYGLSLNVDYHVFYFIADFVSLMVFAT